jgi:tetratricopeptide (TPR) repeat protein
MPVREDPPMKNPLALAVLLAPALAVPAAAQDTIIKKDGSKMYALITSINYKEVTYEDPQAPGIAQQMDASAVKDFQFDPSNKQGDYPSAENAMNRGDFAEAIEKFNRAKDDTRLNQPLREIARYNVILCCLELNKLPQAIEAARALRSESKDSFYIEPSFRRQYEAARALRDGRAIEQAISEFKAAAAEKNVTTWASAAEMMGADLSESKGTPEGFREGMGVFKKYSNERGEIGVTAKLGLLRCTAGAKDWGSLKSQAERILSSVKTEDGVDGIRLLMGAHAAKGQALLYGDKNAYEGFLELARVDVQLAGKAPDQTREIELAMGHMAIAAAAVANDRKDKDEKETWRSRAMEIAADLKARFGDSPLWRAADAAAKGVK